MACPGAGCAVADSDRVRRTQSSETYRFAMPATKWNHVNF